MPNKWKIGGVTGLAVDKDDNVWVYDRPNDLRDMELKAELTPAIADCCVRPPSMIHIDKTGNVIGSFDPPQGHGMAVDSKGFVYLGNAVKGMNTVRKYDPKSGQMLKEVPRIPETQGGGGEDDEAPAARQPGRGGPGPTGTFPAQRGGGAGRGNGNAAAQQAAAAAFLAKYPPSTPMIVGQIEEVRLDEAANELYAADSSFGGRVMVFDLDTFAFKRGWGAYGHKLSEIDPGNAARVYTPGGPFAKEFRGHLTFEHLERRVGLRRGSRRQSHSRDGQTREVREGNSRRDLYGRRLGRWRDVLARQAAALPVCLRHQQQPRLVHRPSDRNDGRTAREPW
jgi:DNA-binding beta-propeller fold protein YncE